MTRPSMMRLLGISNRAEKGIHRFEFQNTRFETATLATFNVLDGEQDDKY